MKGIRKLVTLVEQLASGDLVSEYVLCYELQNVIRILYVWCTVAEFKEMRVKQKIIQYSLGFLTCLFSPDSW